MQNYKYAVSIAVALLCLVLVLFYCPSAKAQQCYSHGDIDGDGTALTITDYIYLKKFIEGHGPAPVPLWEGDVNSDCRIDSRDLALFECLMAGILDCYQVYPFPTCCNPDTVRGACCRDTLPGCQILTPANCAALGGVYKGDGVPCTTGSPCKRCGDMNEDGSVDISDVVRLLECIFVCNPIPQQAEVDCSGSIDISDVVYMIAYIFGGGSAPCAHCK